MNRNTQIKKELISKFGDNIEKFRFEIFEFIGKNENLKASADHFFNCLEHILRMLDTELARKLEQLAILRREKFGRRSEKQYLLPGFEHYFERNPATTTAGPSQEESAVIHSGDSLTSASEAAATPSRTEPRKRQRRTPVYDGTDVAERHVHHYLGLDGKDSASIDQDAVETGCTVFIEYGLIPARPEKIYHYYHKVTYLRNGKKIITVPQRTPSLLPGSQCDLSFFVTIACCKFFLHLPLYRNAMMLRHMNFHISRQTLSNQRIRVAESSEVKEYIACLERELRRRRVINMDETPLQVNRRKKGGRPTPGKTCMWIAIGGPERPVVYFHHGPGRGADVIPKILGSEHGFRWLQSDGAPMYTVFCEGLPENPHVECWQHARRSFADILKIMGEKASENSVAAAMVKDIGELFHVEKACRRQLTQGTLTTEEFVAEREKKSRSVLDSIKARVARVLPGAPKGLRLGKGLNYISQRWETLTRYLKDADLRPDNSICERHIRPLAVGRKNWLFCETERGANAAAVFYTLIETARAIHLDPWKFLYCVLKKLPVIKYPEIDSLMPWNIDLGSVY